MNKKWTSLALALALGLSLTACAGGGNTTQTTPPETTAPAGSAAPVESAADSDLAYVTANGKLKIGFTYLNCYEVSLLWKREYKSY